MALSSPSYIHPRTIIAIQILLSFLLSIIILHPSLSARWSLEDDHEIIDFLGKDQRLSFLEIPKILVKTEAGFQNGRTRYRPVYYLMKLLEASMWGNNPLPWYASRIFMFGASIAIVWILLRRYMGFWAGGMVSLFFLSHSFWVFLRSLGPSENYCILGLALYSLAFAILLGQKKSHNVGIWWITLSFGAILCMGSKENFLFLLPLTAILLIHLWNNKRLNLLSTVSISLIFIFGLFIFVALVFVLRKNGGLDCYSADRDPIILLKLLLSGFFSFSHWKIQLPLWISMLLFSSAFLLNKYYKGVVAELTLRKIRLLFFNEILCVFIWYSQFVYYYGFWPTGSRYDFPGVLARDAAYIFLYFFLLSFLNNSPIQSRFGRSLKGIKVVMVVTLSIFILHRSFYGLMRVHKAVIHHRDVTKKNEELLLTTISQAKKNPECPILFVCRSAYNFEPVLSIGKFLKAYNIDNPLVIILQGLSEGVSQNSTQLKLLKELKKLSNGEDCPKDLCYFLKPKFYSADFLSKTIEPCSVIRL